CDKPLRLAPIKAPRRFDILCGPKMSEDGILSVQRAACAGRREHIHKLVRGEAGCLFGGSLQRLRFEWQSREPNPRVALRKKITAPLFLKQNHRLAAAIERKTRAGWKLRLINGALILRAYPAQHFPGRRLEPRFSAVLRLHPILHHFELKRTHRAEQ